MQFKGQLLLPDDQGPGLKVSLDVAAHHLAVESEDGGLGAWPLEVVDVERLDGDIFALTVAGEPLRFVAEDTIDFAYSGVPTIEKTSTRTSRRRPSFRSMLDKIWNGPDKSTPKAPAEPVSNEADDDEVVVPEPLRPLVADAAPTVEETTEADTAPEGVGETGIAEPVVHTGDRPGLTETGEDLAQEEGCPAIRSDGRRCESPILTSSGYCYPHDPKRAFEDRYKAAQDARAKLKRDSTARLNRIYGRLDKAMRQVERGELDPETAMAMAQIASTMCAILGVDDPSGDPSA